MRRLAAAGFWCSATGAGWVLAGYPAFLALRPARRSRVRDIEPTVSIVVPTYRELETMPEKLRALARLDYPADRVQLIVSVDGDPRLVDAARAAAPDAEVVLLERRSGKAAAINEALGRATGEILVLTDANNVLAPVSVRAAVRHFADPAVWAVAGQREESGSAYDRYEDLLRRLEARSGSVAAISGDFIAVRSDRMPKLPVGIVNEDLWLLLALVRAGGRVTYEPLARSVEPALATAGEVARRSRIGAGRLMLAAELRRPAAGLRRAGGLAQVRPPGPAVPDARRARVLAAASGPRAVPARRKGAAGRLRPRAARGCRRRAARTRGPAEPRGPATARRQHRRGGRCPARAPGSPGRPLGRGALMSEWGHKGSAGD